MDLLDTSNACSGLCCDYGNVSTVEACAQQLEAEDSEDRLAWACCRSGSDGILPGESI